MDKLVPFDIPETGIAHIELAQIVYIGGLRPNGVFYGDDVNVRCLSLRCGQACYISDTPRNRAQLSPLLSDEDIWRQP